MSEEKIKKQCRGTVNSKMCKKTVLPNKGYCAEHEKEFSCVRCKQEIWEKGINIRIGDEYTRQEGTDKKRNLCWNC